MAKLNYEGLVSNKLYHVIEYAEKKGVSVDEMVKMFQTSIDIIYNPASITILREMEVKTDELHNPRP